MKAVAAPARLRRCLLLPSVAALAAGCGTGGAQPPVSPGPGTQVASPQTQVSFPGKTAADVGAVSVTGSRSGRHAGALHSYAAERGVSFVPASPFTPGESVTVATHPARGHSPEAFRFGIARVASLPSLEGSTPFAESAPRYARRFRSRPDLQPAPVSIRTRSAGLAPGLVFLTTGAATEGPMILDDSGRLVWFDPASTGQVADLRVQTYAGRPVLTWWQGQVLNGHGRGSYVIEDSSYRQIATVSAGNGYQGDLHEFLITPQGTALLTAYAPVYRDLSAVGGPKRGVALDSIVQEVDIKTGLVLFEWHSLDHVGLRESYVPAPRSASVPFDYFHVNSIDLDTDGNLIVSARNTDAVYEINRRTGAVMWRLGGKHSSFAMSREARFAFQHDARRQADGGISVFDDGAAPQVHSQSRGLALSLDTLRMRATVTREYRHTRALLAANQGNMQVLPNGDAFVGWGNQPYFSEFDPNGKLIFDARLAPGGESYRAYRFPWTGTPAQPPAIAAQRGRRGTATVWASWNGATQVATWRVLGGPRPTALGPVGAVSWQGFESAARVASGGPWFEVEALARNGHVLAASRAVRAAG